MIIPVIIYIVSRAACPGYPQSNEQDNPWDKMVETININLLHDTICIH